MKYSKFSDPEKKALEKILKRNPPPNLEALVENKLVEMMKENSEKVLSYFAVQAARKCLELAGGTFTISLEATIEGKRYKIVNKTEIEEV